MLLQFRNEMEDFITTHHNEIPSQEFDSSEHKTIYCYNIVNYIIEGIYQE